MTDFEKTGISDYRRMFQRGYDDLRAGYTDAMFIDSIAYMEGQYACQAECLEREAGWWAYDNGLDLPANSSPMFIEGYKAAESLCV